MKKQYIRQQDNLLYEKLIYTGEFHQSSKFTFVVYDKKNVFCDSFNNVPELSSFIDKPGVKWLAIEGLADTESLETLFQMLDIDRLWMQDIVNSRHIAKIDLLDDDILVVLDYFYRFDSILQKEHIAIVLKKNMVITFQETPSPRFSTVLKALYDPKVKLRHSGADYLFNIILSSIIDSYLLELDEQRLELIYIEEQLLDDATDNVELSRSLQIIRKSYLFFRKNILPLRGEFFHLENSQHIKSSSKIYFVDTQDHLGQVFQLLDSEQAVITSLTDYISTANEQRTNSIISRLTILSAIFIPLTFMVGVWGMNFKYMPELDYRWGYLVALLSMLLIGVLVIVYFRIKKWL